MYGDSEGIVKGLAEQPELSTAKRGVLSLLVVDNSINLSKYTVGWFFRHGAVRTDHLILK